jgi:hypothetical protein
MVKMQHVRVPRKLPVILSPEAMGRLISPRAREAHAFAVSPVVEAVKALVLIADAPSQKVAPLQRLVAARQRLRSQPANREGLQRGQVAFCAG